MSKPSILVVDDEPDIRELLEITLNRMGLDTHSCATIAEAEAALAMGRYDLCLTDMRLPDGDGLDLVDHIQSTAPCTPVAVITAHGNMDAAVRALKSGAFDFVSKPIELGQLREMVTAALKLQPGDGAGNTVHTETPEQLLGDAPAMQQLKQAIGKLARSQAPVYIHGESGTGKELVARSIHNQGARAEGPFIPVNCSAIPGELLESEFFGHKKGSFTGATSDKLGLFQAADGGTLFLDEVADLPIQMQVKLLRAIQEKAIRPVGASHEESVDVRILSASHKDLEQLVAKHEFRQDLFYRINVIRLDIPALRHRHDDIPPIATHILNKLAQRTGETPRQLSPQALTALQEYHFPGNVRELENILERACALCDSGTIEADDLQLPATAPAQTEETPKELPQGFDLKANLDSSEKAKIEAALEKTRWNKTEAAKLLGLTFRQLRYRIKKLNIE